MKILVNWTLNKDFLCLLWIEITALDQNQKLGGQGLS